MGRCCNHDDDVGNHDNDVDDDDDELEQCCDGRPCMCLPYNDGHVIAAQVLSILAVLMSWVWWATFVIGIIATALLQVLWCRRQKTAAGIQASAVVAFVACGACLFAGCWMAIMWRDAYNCYPFDWMTYTNDDDRYDYNYCNQNVWASVAFVDAVLWAAVGGCLLRFVSTGKHAKWEKKHNEKTTRNRSAVATIEIAPLTTGKAPTEAPPSATVTVPPGEAEVAKEDDDDVAEDATPGDARGPLAVSAEVEEV